MQLQHLTLCTALTGILQCSLAVFLGIYYIDQVWLLYGVWLFVRHLVGWMLHISAQHRLQLHIYMHCAWLESLAVLALTIVLSDENTLMAAAVCNTVYSFGVAALALTELYAYEALTEEPEKNPVTPV